MLKGFQLGLGLGLLVQGYCVFVDAEHALDPVLAKAIGVAALVPKSELDGEMGDAHMAMQARLMSQTLRKLSHSLSMSQTILIIAVDIDLNAYEIGLLIIRKAGVEHKINFVQSERS
ncbi:hypothetical protein POM88_001026 [Heracleum sosnowskyi]|uniref:RecA-like N-terminal domain-containing protein n=1 Tax=Heracleum sosnowskyi TaxID=360622 RepID=A0AAD8JCX2_9APIA|nr:hypothetical protein POM88_001026 [Heracleum sosnowskyi]